MTFRDMTKMQSETLPKCKHGFTACVACAQESVVKEFGLRIEPSEPTETPSVVPLNPPNPKQRYGDLKPDIAKVPGSASAYMAISLELGAKKYGAFNWRVTKVEAMTYVAALKRHLDAWVDGEEISCDAEGEFYETHNLGAVLACAAILVDALEGDFIIDNRPLPGPSSKLHEKIKAYRQRYIQEHSNT